MVEVVAEEEMVVPTFAAAVVAVVGAVDEPESRVRNAQVPQEPIREPRLLV